MRIPGWLGPIAGPIIALGIYGFLCARQTLEFSVPMALGMAAIGFVAGGLMWLGDRFGFK